MDELVGIVTEVDKEKDTITIDTSKKPFQEWHENRNKKKIKRKLARKARRVNRS